MILTFAIVNTTLLTDVIVQSFLKVAGILINTRDFGDFTKLHKIDIIYVIF